MTYRVTLAYEPDPAKVKFVQEVYRDFDLRCPSEKELRGEVQQSEPGSRVGVRVTFHTHNKEKVLRLVDRVMDTRGMAVLID